jgi:hypothetical protein
MSVATTPGRDFYEQQVAHLENGNLDGLMAQYHEDAVLVSFDNIIRGNVNIRRHLEKYLANLGSFKLKSTDKFIETDDSIMFEATIVTDHAEAKVYDVFVLDNGKATHQFTGAISIQPFSVPAPD